MDLCLNSEFMMIFNTSSLKNGKKLARNEEMQVLTIFMYFIFQIPLVHNRSIKKAAGEFSQQGGEHHHFTTYSL